jgi:hypothetical protein
MRQFPGQSCDLNDTASNFRRISHIPQKVALCATMACLQRRFLVRNVRSVKFSAKWRDEFQAVSRFPARQQSTLSEIKAPQPIIPD